MFVCVYGPGNDKGGGDNEKIFRRSDKLLGRFHPKLKNNNYGIFTCKDR